MKVIYLVMLLAMVVSVSASSSKSIYPLTRQEADILYSPIGASGNITNNYYTNNTYYVNTTVVGGANISVINGVASLNISAYDLCIAANGGNTGNCDGSDNTGSGESTIAGNELNLTGVTVGIDRIALLLYLTSQQYLTLSNTSGWDTLASDDVPFSYVSSVVAGNRTQMETQWRLELSSNVTDVRTSITGNLSIVDTRINANTTYILSQERSEVSSNITDVRTSINANVTAVYTQERSEVSANITDVRTSINSNVTAIYTQTRLEDSGNKTFILGEIDKRVNGNLSAVQTNGTFPTTLQVDERINGNTTYLLAQERAERAGNLTSTYNSINANITDVRNSINANISSLGVMPGRFNLTTKDFSSNSSIQTGNPNYAQVSIMTLPISGNKNISLECVFNQMSNVSTTGVIWNISVTGTRIIQAQYNMDYPTSATATANCPLTVALQKTVIANPDGKTHFPCLQTGTGQAPRRAVLTGVFNTNASDGMMNITFHSEVQSTNANVSMGSWCRTVEVSG